MSSYSNEYVISSSISTYLAIIYHSVSDEKKINLERSHVMGVLRNHSNKYPIPIFLNWIQFTIKTQSCHKSKFNGEPGKHDRKHVRTGIIIDWK